jgi:hypothetical protein
MPKLTSRFMLAFAILSVLGSLALCDEPATKESKPNGGDISAREDKTGITVSRGDRPVLRYRFGDVPMKPYVEQLFSPGGVQVLRDSPHDHKHHHALMFGVAVDGVDFWAEFPQSGRQKKQSIETIDPLVLMPNGRWVRTTGAAEELNWTAPNSDKPLLVEMRKVYALSKPPADIAEQAAEYSATLIEWESRLETPPGKEKITLSGGHYFGLGLRFLRSMDGGRFFNADDKPGEIVQGDERLTPTRWCAYTANADGKPVTVAMFDQPENVRYPAKMFTMSKPFAYLSATINLWKEPLDIKADKPLTLRYAVAVWDGEVDTKVVEKLYRRWLELSSDK